MVVKVSVEHISKSFPLTRGTGTVEVLRDVSFTAEDGEIVSVIGPTGCGKSTLLRMISGLSIPSSGIVTIGGRKVTGPNNPASGIVFQSFNLLPWRNVISNVEFGLEAKGLPPEERKKIASKYVELVGLKNFEFYHPHQISGGMQQRVGLARALAIDPEVILLDEPFSSLDMLTRESLQQEVLKILQNTGKTAILVTHNIDEALVLSNKIITLGGRPSGIKGVFNVNLPYPRTDESLITNEVVRLRAALKQQLLNDASLDPKKYTVGAS